MGRDPPVENHCSSLHCSGGGLASPQSDARVGEEIEEEMLSEFQLPIVSSQRFRRTVTTRQLAAENLDFCFPSCHVCFSCSPHGSTVVVFARNVPATFHSSYVVKLLLSTPAMTYFGKWWICSMLVFFWAIFQCTDEHLCVCVHSDSLVSGSLIVR